MLDYEYIEIEKALIPYRFEMELGAELFLIEIRYNELHDYFSLDLQKDGEVLVCGEKLVYATPLFSEVFDGRFPAPKIIPLDTSGKETRVSFENLNETVFLKLVNGNE
ncbi:phage baseplate plug family protein [Lysinibacillus sp. FSL W8-0953]|uniref:phage baseplate plug family protein n=1 Tax=Lysinibacillus sp. FSL W8-0953 TaxID=2954640 RepID=UPI0030FB8FDD